MKAVTEFACFTVNATRYRTENISLFTDYLPNQLPCESEESPYDAWVKFVATNDMTSISWRDYASLNQSLYFYKELSPGSCPGTEPNLSFLGCRDRTGQMYFEWYTFSTIPGATYYILSLIHISEPTRPY